MTPKQALAALERRMNLLNQIVQEAMLGIGYKRHDFKEEEKKEERKES